MDFRDYLAKAEASLAEKRDELDASIKKAKEAELAFIEKKDGLKDKEAKLKAQEKEVDAKLLKLSRLEIIERDEMKAVEREAAVEEKERIAKKMLDDAATMKLKAEQGLQSAKDVMDKANRAKAEIEGKILEKFKKIVMEA